jgi:hypothetical protein
MGGARLTSGLSRLHKFGGMRASIAQSTRAAVTPPSLPHQATFCDGVGPLRTPAEVRRGPTVGAHGRCTELITKSAEPRAEVSALPPPSLSVCLEA